MNSSLLLGLHAHTWIHAGSGEKDGVVDLPIQREAHTGWPVIFGSSLKGAMRSQVSRTKGGSGRTEPGDAIWTRLTSRRRDQ
ncbi:RAMP superfamily CRISPR-associated protein [Aeromonas veronii]|uniref:RAMP superfamily CRISPR-associated protein n=1 Tax=Aeromonas veronii TaxID=654 RepID=UPI002444E5C3|nr:RAMP superfamily CRISPR-associated protein [Aeromonas veronii]